IYAHALRIRSHRAPHLYGRPPNSNRPEPPLDGNLGRPLGGGHNLRRGYGRIQRQDLARSPGSPPQRSIARRRALPAREPRSLGTRYHHARPQSAGEALDDNIFLRAEAKVGAGGNLARETTWTLAISRSKLRLGQ